MVGQYLQALHNILHNNPGAQQFPGGGGGGGGGNNNAPPPGNGQDEGEGEDEEEGDGIDQELVDMYGYVDEYDAGVYVCVCVCVWGGCGWGGYAGNG